MTRTTRYWCPIHDETHGPNGCPYCKDAHIRRATKINDLTPLTAWSVPIPERVLAVLSEIVNSEERTAAERIAAADVILKWYKP